VGDLQDPTFLQEAGAGGGHRPAGALDVHLDGYGPGAGGGGELGGEAAKGAGGVVDRCGHALTTMAAV
jgi:hypothetical protein